MSHELPFQHLNLRRNPFGELTEQERTQLALVEIDEFVERLKNPRYVVQFIGEKGFGKTTHLLSIRAACPNAGYVHIPEGERAMIPSGVPILIDEAQRLTTWQWVKLFRSQVPLVLGTHRDFTISLRRAGRIVETIQPSQRTDADRVHQILNQRIEYVRRDDGPVPKITKQTSDRLRSQFGHDIRSMQDSLYETFQALREIRDV